MYVFGRTSTAAYHTPAPALGKVVCDSLLDGSPASTQQAQVAPIHKEMAMYTCFLHALGRELHHTLHNNCRQLREDTQSLEQCIMYTDQ